MEFILPHSQQPFSKLNVISVRLALYLVSGLFKGHFDSNIEQNKVALLRTISVKL